MRIIKFKYRHIEKAHWEEWTKNRKRKERNSKIKGQMRTDRKGMIREKKREKKASRRKQEFLFFVHVNTEL